MGVDIGNRGGICFNVDDKVALFPMPHDTKENPNPLLVNEKWKTLSEPYPDIMVAEDVHAFAGQGIVSTGTLLRNKGQVEMAAAAIGAELILIQPLAWIECYTMKRKKHFKRTKAEMEAKMPTWKQHLVEIAMCMLPEGTLVNERTADAFLIWNFWAAKLIGKPLKKMGSQLSFKL